MKTSARALLLLLPTLLFTACTFVPKIGMKETKWLNHTVAADLVYAVGDVRAYRSAGAYYYFKNGSLVVVGQSLVTADKVQP